MEASTIAATLLQSSEVDTVMTTNNQDNVNIQNGFMDPRVLQIDHELPGLDSTEPLSRDESQPLSVSSKAMTTNRKSNLPTGCCYDDRMKLHANADFSASPHHPEDPRRIEAIMTEFKNAGLLYSGDEVQLAEILKDGSHHEWMWRIAARRARIDEITMVHDTEHYEWVRKLSTLSSADLRRMTSDFDNGRKSLYVGNLTYEAALISAGGAIETCKNVVVGNIKNAIAVIRPPGHHAERDESLGFCIFNNVPIAARVCQADYPDICRKVLILDWDVHHGNGIQNIFYEDPNVLYISIHVYQNGIFYPGQPEKEGIPDGDIDKCGKGLGIGKNVNIGWAEQGVGDGEYMAAFQRIVMPIAHEFNPDLVIVSAGFDAAAGDELGGCWVTPACYSHMTHMLMSLAEGKVAVCLEGGYNLRAISKSALAVARTLMGEPPERLPLPPINKTAAQTLDNVIRIQSRYWDCLRAPSVGSEVLKERGAERVSDVVRKHQAIKLNEAFGMIPLYIQRTKLASVFENQVLVSAGLEEAKKILMIIHDPPDFQAFVDGESQQPATYAHNAFITDGTVPYIRWAINDGYAVIDVNIPQSLAEPTDPDPYVPKQTENELQTQTKDLLCYLWDNYLELNPNASISLVGVGDAYLGIKQLLISRGKSFSSDVFIENPNFSPQNPAAVSQPSSHS